MADCRGRSAAPATLTWVAVAIILVVIAIAEGVIMPPFAVEIVALLDEKSCLRRGHHRAVVRCPKTLSSAATSSAKIATTRPRRSH
jgi:hypothetical protein